MAALCGKVSVSVEALLLPGCLCLDIRQTNMSINHSGLTVGITQSARSLEQTLHPRAGVGEGN
jgi:hypothetical protein